MKWYVTIAIAHHFNGSAERHLKKINGCRENDGDICHLALQKSSDSDYTERSKSTGMSAHRPGRNVDLQPKGLLL